MRINQEQPQRDDFTASLLNVPVSLSNFFLNKTKSKPCVQVVISVLRRFSTTKAISAGVQLNLVILRTVQKSLLFLKWTEYDKSPGFERGPLARTHAREPSQCLRQLDHDDTHKSELNFGAIWPWIITQFNSLNVLCYSLDSLTLQMAGDLLAVCTQWIWKHRKVWR